MELYKQNKMLLLFFLVSLILVGLLNFLWFVTYNFDKNPIVAIDLMFVLNIVIALFVIKRLPLSSAMLVGTNILIALLGFSLIKGFIIG